MIFLQFSEQWEQRKFTFYAESRERIVEIFEKYFYNEEFDPGSGWTLATGLTHASRGAARGSNTWVATGARVRNAYPTFPLLLDSLPKGRLIQDGVQIPHVIWTKDLSVSDGDAYH